MTDLVLFRHNLLTVVDVEALLGFMVERATQQVEVTVSSVGLDGLDDRLNASGDSRWNWDVGIIMNIIRVGHIAIAHGAHASVVKQGVVQFDFGLCWGTSRCRSVGGSVGHVEAAEGVEFGLGIVGFSEPTSFYRYFKRVTGMTAKKYRDITSSD